MASTQPSLVVYRGFPGSGIYIWSPFVTKLEARLRFAGLSYRTEVGSKSQSPRDKLPYISISQPNSTPIKLSDSTLIVAKFIQDGLLDDLNAKLSPADKAHDLAIRALLEDKLCFYQVSVLWPSDVIQALIDSRHTKGGMKTTIPCDQAFSGRCHIPFS